MKFKIKKQLLNETDGDGPQISLFGNSPGAEKIKDQLGNVLSYNEDPDAFDSPPIRDAIVVKNFLKTADDEVASTLTTKFGKLETAIKKVIDDYKEAKRTAATDKTDAERAAATKEKEAQQAPMKKAIRTLVLFALNADSKDLVAAKDIAAGVYETDENKFKYNDDKLIQYLDKIKEALKFVQEHELESLKEVELMESGGDIITGLINDAFENPEKLKKITDIIRQRIGKIEQEKAGRDRADADEKAKAEKFEKNKELLFKVLRFFQEKVGIESIRIPPDDGKPRSKKKTVELAKELQKDFPTFDTLYNFLNKIIGEIINKLVEYGAIQQGDLDNPGADVIFNTSGLGEPEKEASIRLYAELKTIGKKFRKTLNKLLEFERSFAKTSSYLERPNWELKNDQIQNLWRIIDAAVSESKKYKLKLIENKRG